MTTLPPFVRERFKPTEAEYRHALSLIPPDTRDLTGVLMGDPLPGDVRRPKKDAATIYLRVPGSLKRQVDRAAKDAGVSVNKFVTAAFEHELGADITIQEPARFGDHHGSPHSENAGAALNDD